MSTKLIFIYNAKSGKLNALLDTAHKIFSPGTYECNLCALTFDNFSENKKWRVFRETSKVEMEFLHIDEYKKNYASKFGHKFTFPIVLIENNGELEVFISTKKLNVLNSTEELINLMKNSLM